MNTRIAVVADFNADSRSHVATDDALEHSAMDLGGGIVWSWLPTQTVGKPEKNPDLKDAAGIWIGPGSPYANMNGALDAIRFARENGIPLLGTCGGFQHIIIEYARNVLGIADAEHEESAPDASKKVISRLACSLAGRTMAIRLHPESRLRKIMDQAVVEEDYLCNFGVNPDYAGRLSANGPLKVIAGDDEGAVRAVELDGHPFFIGTLFLPQHRSKMDQPHPLVSAFLQAAAQRENGA